MSELASTGGALRRAARLEAGEGRRLALSVLLAFGTVLAGAGLLTTSGYLISRAAQRPEILALTAAITAVRGFGIARAALRYGERLASHDLALRVLARLRAGFYALLAPLGPAALGHRRSGELLSRFVADVDALQDLYLRALAPPIVGALVIVSAGLFGWVLLPAAGLVVGGGLLVAAILVPTLTGMLAAAAGRRQAPARAALSSELVEAIDGSVELAVAGRGPERVGRLDLLGDRLAWIARRDALAGACATVLGSLLIGFTILAALLVSIPAVRNGSLSPVLLAAIVFLVLGAFEGIAPLPAAARTLRGCAEAAGRLDELRNLNPAVRDPERPVPVPDLDAPLRLRDVAFRYSTDDEWLLKDVDLTLEPGCRVALIGPSGAGKTTLAQLLVRFLDPALGVVAVGDVDVRELSLHDVRGTVVLAAQDAHVFTTTIRENLLLARRAAGEDDLWDALEAVQLDAWVRELPDGLDTLVGEDGDLLSGGQRQRLAVARALVSDARFLVLDEPTAHLDAETAGELIRGIDAAAGPRGVVVITHRAEGLERFDRVLRLSDGRLEPVVPGQAPAWPGLLRAGTAPS